MGKKNSKIQQEATPTLAQYLAQRAQQVRDSAAFELSHQDSPDIPVLPRVSDNTIAYWDAKFGTPDSTLIQKYGVEPNPETCIYTATTKYGDKDAVFTGNKTFRNEYNKHGYVEVPNDSSSIGDLVQLNQLWGLPIIGRPYHAVMQTSTSDKGTPLFSYSRGDTTPFVIEEGDTIKTMQKDKPLNTIKGRADSHTTYRYVGSPSKQAEWTNEYNNKYGTQRSNGRLGVTSRWAEGGSLKGVSAWDNLSMVEKAAMIGVAVKNGITTLPEIRTKYNEFAEGGSTDADLVDRIIKEEGFNTKPENIGDGKITLGSGLTAQKWHDLYKQRGNKWSNADNRKAVAEEVANRRRWVEKNIPNWDKLPDSSQKALLSYKYNYDFNKNNSPKLFDALEKGDLYEAARQMDATSKDTKFKKGLQARRQREQKWFLSDVASKPVVPTIPFEQPVSTVVFNPYAQQIESTRIAPIMIPDEDSYVTAHRLTEAEEREQKFQERMEALRNFNRLLQMTSLDNTAVPAFMPTTENTFLDNIMGLTRAEGGKIHIKPENRGKFTALKERTGHSATWFKEHGTPAQKKMATFALNAGKWKHGEGGNLFFTGGPEKRGREEVTNLSVWDELAAQSPLLYTIGKAVDPTGISGYGDAREAINQYDNAPSLNNGYAAVMETLGALPIVSKVGKAIKFLQRAVTGQGIFDDYNHAQEKMKEYGDELVVDYWDNTVKPRWEAERHGEQMKSKMSYTDIHHVPSFKLAPKDSKPGQVISNYTVNHRVVNKYKKALGGNLFVDGGDSNPMNYEYRGSVIDDELKRQGITHIAELPEVTITGRDLAKPYKSVFAFNPTNIWQFVMPQDARKFYNTFDPNRKYNPAGDLLNYKLGYNNRKSVLQSLSASGVPLNALDSMLYNTPEAALALYLDLGDKEFQTKSGTKNDKISNYFKRADYKPTKGKTYPRVYKLARPEGINTLAQEDYSIPLLNDYIFAQMVARNNGQPVNVSATSLKDVGITPVGTEGTHAISNVTTENYTIGLGKDLTGPYISYYDEYDLNADIFGNPKTGDVGFSISDPFSIYDRKYYNKEDSAKVVNAYRNYGESAFDRHGKLKKEYE